MKKLFFLIVFLLMVSPAFSAEKFVRSTGGSDSNNGNTNATAYATIAKGLENINAGDTLWMCAGACDGSGTAHFNVSIGSTGQTIPNGTNWTIGSGAIYVSAWANETITVNSIGLTDRTYHIWDGIGCDHSLGDLATSDTAVCLAISGGHHLRFQNAEYRNCRWSCILTTHFNEWGHHWEFINLDVHDSGQSGVGDPPHGFYLTGGYQASGEDQESNILIENCRIYNNDTYPYSEGISIFEYVDPGVLFNNYRGVLIRNNRIYNNGVGLQITPGGGDQAEVYNNYFYDNFEYTLTFNSGGNKAYNNTLYGNNWALSSDGPDAIGNEFKNNISYNNSKNFNDSGSGTVCDQNIGVNDSCVMTSPGDPLFVNPVSKDFRIQAGSPAVDNGVTIADADITTDLFGTGRPQGSAWDIGAHELTQSGGGSGTPHAGNSSVDSFPAAVENDGIESSTITVTVRDASNNPVAGASCALTDGAGSASWTPATAISNGSGVATFTTTNTTDELVTFTATCGGVGITDTATVDFDAGPGGGGDPGAYSRSLITSETMTHGSTTCMHQYSSTKWVAIHDGGTTNCVQIQASATKAWGSTATSVGWAVRVNPANFTFSGNHYSSWTISEVATSSNKRMRVLSRVQATTGASRAYYSCSYAFIDSVFYTTLHEWSGDSTEILGTQRTDVAWADGDELEIESFGNTHRCLRNGIVVITATDTTSPLTGGTPGLAISEGSSTDNAGGPATFGDLVTATDVYVSSTGNDTTGAGTLASPWLTINKGWQTVGASGTIYLCAGACAGSGSATFAATIDEDVVSPVSGVTNARTTLRAYPGEVITIQPTAGCNPIDLNTVDWIAFQDLIIDAVNVTCSSVDTITHDTSVNPADSGNPATFSVTVANQSNRLMLIGCHIAATTNNSVISTVTYNGDAATLVLAAGNSNEGTNFSRTEVWRLIAPDIGTANVVATPDAEMDGYLRCGATVIYGAHQTTPIRDSDSSIYAGVETSSIALTSVAGDWAWDFIGFRADPGMVTIGAGQTLRGTYSGDVDQRSSTEVAAGSTTTMSWSWDTPRFFAHVAVSVAPASVTAPAYGVDIAAGSTGILFDDVTIRNAEDEALMSAGPSTEFRNGILESSGKGATLSGSGSVIDNTEVQLHNLAGITVAGNLIDITRNNIHGNAGDGLVTSGNIDDLDVFNNLFSSNANGIMLTVNAPTDARIYQNTFCSNTTRNWNVATGSGHLITNNVSYPAGASANIATSATAANNTTADPDYVNETSCTDLHLSVGSAAINAGADLTAVVPNDKDGHGRIGAPDTGAYEFVTIPAVTGISRSLIRQGQTVSITVTGSNLDGGSAAIAFSGSGITTSGCGTATATSFTCNFTAALSTAIGQQTVTVNTTAGNGVQGTAINVISAGGPLTRARATGIR